MKDKARENHVTFDPWLGIWPQPNAKADTLTVENYVNIGCVAPFQLPGEHMRQPGGDFWKGAFKNVSLVE